MTDSKTGQRTAAQHEAELKQRLSDAIDAKEAAIDRELDEMSGQQGHEGE